MNAEPAIEQEAVAQIFAQCMSQPFTQPSMTLKAVCIILEKIAELAAKVDAFTLSLNERGNTASEPLGERPLKAKELCRLMDVSNSTLTNWRKSPDFPVVEQKGRGKRPIRHYILSEVRAWHEKQLRIAQEMAK